MKRVILFLVALFCYQFGATAQTTKEESNEKIAIVWTSDDPAVAKEVAFVYARNASKRGWFDEVVFIVWGPSAKLLAESSEMQKEVQAMKEAGVVLEACLACTDSYKVTDKLKGMGIDVKYMGAPLSTYIKEGYRTLTF